MNITQLISIVNQLRYTQKFTGWEYRQEAIEMLKNKKAELIESEWIHNPSYWTNSRECKPNIHEETTYDLCIDASLTTKNNQLLLNINIYNGDMAYGQPTSERCRFQLIIKESSPLIEKMGQSLLSRLTQQVIEEEDKLRFDNTRQKILDNL